MKGKNQLKGVEAGTDWGRSSAVFLIKPCRTCGIFKLCARKMVIKKNKKKRTEARAGGEEKKKSSEESSKDGALEYLGQII